MKTNRNQRSTASPGRRKHIDPLEKTIEAVLSPGSFISYSAAWSFVDDVQDVAGDIGKIIKKKPERACKEMQWRFHCDLMFQHLLKPYDSVKMM